MVGRTPKVSDEEIMNHIREVNDPFVTAKEVAEAVSLSRQAVNNRLNNLHDRNLVDKKSTGSGVGWWVTEGYDPSDSAKNDCPS
ncbi:winged helix-turn-helix domain-containing protein [Halorientalis persicus]|uniref:winged helix-turn-helix domain-containing protein n=1 Tax=Halorientalis persicus TaxID=1367881 RepID=UPI000B85D499